MNKVNWMVVSAASIAVLLVVLIGVSLLGGFGGYGGWRMGPGMMGGWGPAPSGWAGMLLMWLFPLGFLVLLALGIVWLVKAISQPGSGQLPSTSVKACPNCHRPAQAEWHNCPYCGTALA